MMHQQQHATTANNNNHISWDARLSKGIQRVVILSLLLHVMVMIKTSSKSTGEWLIDQSSDQDLEDVPAVTTSWEAVEVDQDDFHNRTNVGMAVENNVTGKMTKPPDLSLPSDVHAPSQVHRIPLDELIHSQPNVTCHPGQSGKRLIQSTPLPPSLHDRNGDSPLSSSRRRIPKLVHVTSKTRCMTPQFLKNLDKWRFQGYGFYFHDDDAVDRLLAKYWPEFPQLQWLQHCMISGAAKADLWRLLVLWEYGGIYTDIDNAPGAGFQNGSVIQDDDEAWFVVENLGILSQWFMASEPRHPLIYISILVLLERLLDVPNIQTQYVPFVTGPGTLKSSLMYFLKVQEEKVKAGKYMGIGNKTVTVVGRKGHAKEYIIRGSVSGIQKRGGYVAMGMVHFSLKHDTAPNVPCYEYLHQVAKESIQAQRLQSTN